MQMLIHGSAVERMQILDKEGRVLGMASGTTWITAKRGGEIRELRLKLRGYVELVSRPGDEHWGMPPGYGVNPGERLQLRSVPTESLYPEVLH